MNEPWRRSAGPLVVLLTLLVAAFNTRTVIAAVAPIASELRAGLGFDTAALSVVGTLPPLCLAIFAVPAPSLVRLAGLERCMGLALATVSVGHVIRASAVGPPSFIAGTVVTLAGVGIANVLLPPIVRRHFSRRIGGVTALYVVAQSLGTGLPALVGVPLATSLGWRVALGLWAVAGAVALVLWLAAVGAYVRPPAPRVGHGSGVRAVRAGVAGRVWRSPVACAIAALFAVASSNAYAALAWLPQVLVDLVGVSAGVAGTLLAVYGAVGVLPAMVMPVLATRVRDVGLLVQVHVVLMLVGYLGLLFWPSVAVVLWVLLTGVGVANFALCLVLVNLRTRTPLGSVKVSGFVQGTGYSIGALGPLVFGVTHQLAGGWTASIVLLAGTSVVAFASGFVVRRHRFVEDEWHGRPRR